MQALLITSSLGVAPCLPSSSPIHLESLHACPPHHLFILSPSIPALITSSFGVAPCLPSSSPLHLESIHACPPHQSPLHLE